ncbi:transient receptor potential cation channel subfamily A member 1 isoform X2 [Pocillopora verrucosa]|uniref:transient receptor potential cation channel subfamily A member 1 isoform X2 n=1 Tax=Pocillopora verrucosa TaxID=203993 RepID=UPI002796E85B|nr:transient receptor potential cation channel subfamily A member 1-like isoform X2 [Pocillopora verrucosa]
MQSSLGTSSGLRVESFFPASENETDTDSDSGAFSNNRSRRSTNEEGNRLSTPELIRHAFNLAVIKGRINLRFNNRDHHGGLHKAVLNGKEADVEQLLSSGKDIDAHDEYGKTPLHCAVGAQKLDIVHCLLRYKPDVDAHDDRDDTALHTATRTGNFDIVLALLREGHANPNAVGNSGCNPLHIAAHLDHVNSVAICKLLLQYNAKILARDHKNMTPIAHAALHGCYDVMVCLFHYSKGQGISRDDVLLHVDNTDSTLLHLAVESGVAKVVELCLEEGAGPNAVKSSDGSTPVHLASSYGYMDILDILMKAVAFILDPPPDQDGMLPIHKAAQSNHSEVISYLLKQDMDQINATDHERRTPVMLAAQCNCFETAKVLLEHGANVDVRDSENKTVLHYAIGSSDIVKEILKDVKASALIRAKDRLGNTPLHYAACKGCVKDASIILMKYRAGATITNGSGETPLHIAARYGCTSVAKKLMEGRGKRTVNGNDVYERTPLHLAAQQGHDELVEFFLKRGAKIDSDVHGQTPLHYAALQGSKRSAELILASKPESLNVTDKNQNTALHMAAKGGHAEILKYLLSKSEQLVSVNERNQNILDIAIEARQEAVAMGIVEHRRWKEVLRSTTHGSHTQIQLLVQHMPEVAKKFLDRCIVEEGDPEDENYKVSYDLRFIQGMPDEKRKEKNAKESLSALHTMVKYQRLQCLTHTLCSVLMDIKWRKFGLVCALLNQIVYILFVLLLMIMMKKQVDAKHTSGTDPLIALCFKDSWIHASVSVFLIIACGYNLAKELFQMFDEGVKYLFTLNNWLEVTLYVLTLVTLVRPRSEDISEMGICVFLVWIVLLQYISKFNYVGLYIVMITKTIKTVSKVMVILLILLAAFAFSLYVVVPKDESDAGNRRFHNISSSFAATFFMMLDNLQYDNILLNYDSGVGNGLVLYVLYIAYCFMMPIIFLNLLIGLAVGDIDTIRKTAALERYTSQVEHLSQLERAIPTFILNSVLVTEYVEYPNKPKNFKTKIVDILVKLLSPRQENDEKQEIAEDLRETIERHDEQLREITSSIKKQSALLEELRDIFMDKKRRPKREEPAEQYPDGTEFYV